MRLQPNGEYTETVEDLKIKVLGGEVKLARSWINGRWYINPAWGTLRFIADPLGNSIKAIDGSGSVYERSGSTTGTGTLYTFDTVFLQKTDTGWRWNDRVGNWITYDPAGRITAYGDRNNITVNFTYNAQHERTGITDHLGNPILSFTYQNDRLTQIQDRTGCTVTYTWEGDRLKNVSHLGGGNSGPRWHTHRRAWRHHPWNTDYDRSNREYTITTQTPDGRTLVHRYDYLGYLIGQSLNGTSKMTLTRDGKYIEKVTDERSLITTTEYNSNKDPLKITYPDGTSETYAYHTQFNTQTRYTDAAGNVD